MALYKLHGQDGGLKFQDLLDAVQDVSQAGLQAIIGEIVGVEYFLSFLATNGFEQNTDQDQVLSGRIPPDLLTINQELVSGFKTGYPVAVRSSARGERGGTGIYKTVFIVPKANQESNLELLWQAECTVFASEFSADARAYRQKHYTPFGIAVMIQSVVGRHYGKYFCPLLAGSAYTSYGGQRLIRVCLGLGTKAVDSEAVVISKELPTMFDISYNLSHLCTLQAINVESGQCEEIPVPDELRRCFSPEPLIKFWEALRLLKIQKNYYLEWATPDTNPDAITVVQAAPFEDKIPDPISHEATGKVILCQGTDIVNHGKKFCQVVVRAGLHGWTHENVSWLEYLNGILKNYLLIVPQTGFSGFGPLVAGLSFERVPTLSYTHFNNAAALVELQYNTVGHISAGLPSLNHTSGRGGQHFQQICSREDILFIGTETDLAFLHQLECCAKFDRCIKVWQVPIEVVNDATTGQGTIYICGPTVVPEYSVTEIQDFADSLYEAAGAIGDEEAGLAESFYCACHILPIAETVADFDPFVINEEVSREVGGWQAVVNHLEKVLAGGDTWIDNQTWSYGKLQTYLWQLLFRLKLEEKK